MGKQWSRPTAHVVLYKLCAICEQQDRPNKAAVFTRLIRLGVGCGDLKLGREAVFVCNLRHTQSKSGILAFVKPMHYLCGNRYPTLRRSVQRTPQSIVPEAFEAWCLARCGSTHFNERSLRSQTSPGRSQDACISWGNRPYIRSCRKCNVRSGGLLPSGSTYHTAECSQELIEQKPDLNGCGETKTLAA